MSKQLQYLIIHCTATPEGREVTGDEIRRWHTDPVSKGGRGWKQVGYTDMIHLDGTVERLVDNNEDNIVDSWEITNGATGYNAISRHVVYVGGVAKDGKTAKDTRTSAQKKALIEYVKDFQKRFPDVKIIGHNQVAAKACPSFDVPEWLNEIKDVSEAPEEILLPEPETVHVQEEKSETPGLPEINKKVLTGSAAIIKRILTFILKKWRG